MSASVFSVSHLSYAYPENGKNVVNNLNIIIPEKKITAILGINGSGKSTFMHLLLGSLIPDEGQIIFNNEKNKKNNKGSIAFVPQNEYLAFDYTIKEYVLFGRVPYVNIFSTPKEYDLRFADSILRELGLKGLMNKKITHLSGGELQKVRLARALVQNPSVLLLDEPTTYLDIRSKKTILEILTNLKNKGVSVIFATHDPGEAAAIADYFILMRKGKQPYSGYREEVFTDRKLSDTYCMKLRIINLENKQFIVSD